MQCRLHKRPCYRVESIPALLPRPSYKCLIMLLFPSHRNVKVDIYRRPVPGWLIVERLSGQARKANPVFFFNSPIHRFTNSPPHLSLKRQSIISPKLFEKPSRRCECGLGYMIRGRRVRRWSRLLPGAPSYPRLYTRRYFRVVGTRSNEACRNKTSGDSASSLSSI